MANKEEFEIINYALEIGCCKRCALRMLCRNVNFIEPDMFFCLEAGDESTETSKSKRIKTNPCVICLDILEETFISDLVSKIHLNEITAYDSSTYICYLSAPAAVLIREYSIKSHMKKKFPEFYSDLKLVRPLSKVWKKCISKHLDDILQGKKLDDSSLLSIKFNLEYESDAEETSVMIKVDPETFQRRIKYAKKFNDGIFSRGSIEESLTHLSKEIVEKYVASPPLIPTHRVQCKSIDIHSEAIFIAGRYCKYSRTIGQTPWVHEDTNITDCVQDYIYRGIEKVLGCCKDSLTFSASGREDYDVRCLGKGRPFYVQLNDPKTTKIHFKTFRDLEQEINKSKEISVKDLQLVSKSDIKKIKDGEQFKTKHYTALCITEVDDIGKAVTTLNNYGSFEIEQQTPLRVLHRRNLDKRKKMIHEMKARRIEGINNMFILDVLTQAGTYVKELVHGDLKRTNPSITDIIGANTDILALDVNSINLDWPPEIDISVSENDSLEKELMDEGITYKLSRLSQAFRISLQRRLEQAFGKKYDQNSMLEVTITCTYDHDEEEISKMLHLCRAKMKPQQINSNKNKILSRREIFRILHETPFDILKSIFPIPSVISIESVRLTSVEVLHHTIYVAGRYLKFDKKLPLGFNNSHGLEKGEDMESSFSITSWIKAYFSGFFKTSENNILVESKEFFLEEFRVLGLGVPFYLKIANPKLTKISYDEFRILENECNIINIDNGFICRDLQFTDKSAGENMKVYSHCAPRQTVMICSVKNSIFLDLVIKNLNDRKNVDLVQLPIFSSNIQLKPKYLYWMKAKKIRGSDSSFVVEALFSPGIYLDQFIHHETRPSFEQLAGATIKVHCIDIIEYDRRWPSLIENPEPPKASEKGMKKGSVIKVESGEGSAEEIIDLKDIKSYKNIDLPQFGKFELPE